MSSAFAIIIFLLISIVAIIAGAYHVVRLQRLKKNGMAAEGIIQNYVADTLNNSTTYYPVVRFLTDANEWIIEKNPISGYYLPGKKVTVYYNPDNPKEFMIDTVQNRAVPFVIMVAGIAMIAFFIGCFLVTGHLFLLP